MTRFETILRLAELKGRLSHIMLQEVSDVKHAIATLIDDLSVDYKDDEEGCNHEWRLIPDVCNLFGASMFCKLCGERDE